jgi:hypothetical protein
MDFEYVENSLDLKHQLPLIYKELLKNFPLALIERYPAPGEEAETGDESLSTSEELLSDAQSLIQINQNFRDLVENSEAKIDTDHWFVIGSEPGYPNYYLINLQEDSEQVYFFNHEDGEVTKRYSTLSAFLENVYDTYDSQNDPNY